MVAPGTPLVRVVDITPVKIAGGVPERFAEQLAAGRDVQITFNALSIGPVRGRVSFVGNTVDEQSRTFPIEVEVANPGLRIKQEMVATIELPLRELNDAIVVPQQALVRAEGGFLAYVAVDREGALVAEQRSVSVGPEHGNDVVVLNGIEAGDRLIVVGQQKVANGDRVMVSAPKGGGR